MGMPYISRQVEGVSILDLEGEIDLYKSPEVRAEIAKLITKKNKSIVINFQKVTYIDSSGLATMIDAFQKVRAYGGKLGLISLAKSVRSVFEVSRLDKFFPIFEEENSAVASFREDGSPKS
jgi:anti-sigma B factor antagonist